jgi:hypothetical protein
LTPLVHNEPDPERTLRKALAAGATSVADLSDVLAAVEDGSADVVIGETHRVRRDRRERREAARLEQEAAVEEARRMFAEQRP